MTFTLLTRNSIRRDLIYYYVTYLPVITCHRRKVDGRRPRGRSITRWTDPIRSALVANLYVELQSAKERSRWLGTVR